MTIQAPVVSALMVVTKWSPPKVSQISTDAPALRAWPVNKGAVLLVMLSPVVPVSTTLPVMVPVMVSEGPVVAVVLPSKA